MRLAIADAPERLTLRVGDRAMDAEFEKLEKDSLFWDTMHPNEKGHRIIADLIYAKLQELL